MSSLYEMELENIKERTAMGRQVYLAKGGRLGRPTGSNESENKFLKKQKTQEIIKLINKGRTIREIAAITSTSNKTIIKTKKIAMKYGYFLKNYIHIKRQKLHTNEYVKLLPIFVFKKST
jgi:DNA invertase Pin-like site-specific DNA recombinase